METGGRCRWLAEGLHRPVFSFTACWRPSVRAGGMVRRPCHSAACSSLVVGDDDARQQCRSGCDASLPQRARHHRPVAHLPGARPVALRPLRGADARPLPDLRRLDRRRPRGAGPPARRREFCTEAIAAGSGRGCRSYGAHDERRVRLGVFRAEPRPVTARVAVEVDDILVRGVIADHGPHDAVGEQDAADDRVKVHRAGDSTCPPSRRR